MVQSDERITEVEWDARKKCPVCEDIRDKKINLDGEQLFEDDEKKKPFFCPQCGVLDIQLHHEVGALEIGRTSTRGDAQPWTHQMVIKCSSCDWSHVTAIQPCLGNPWDETIGLTRPLEQTKEQKHAIRWSNEQAVGLRDHDEKYDKSATLHDKRYKSKRQLAIDEADIAQERELRYIPDENEKRARKRNLYKKRK